MQPSLSKISVFLLALALALPLGVKAQQDNSITINLLLAQIKQLQEILTSRGLVSQQPNSSLWCYTFNTTLKVGSKGEDVKALIRALELNGIKVEGSTSLSTTFNQNVASAVIEFQQKYRDEVLKPAGLVFGTGTVGRFTKNKLNALYGCKKVLPPPPVVAAAPPPPVVIPPPPVAVLPPPPAVNLLPPPPHATTITSSNVGELTAKMIVDVNGNVGVELRASQTEDISLRKIVLRAEPEGAALSGRGILINNITYDCTQNGTGEICDLGIGVTIPKGSKVTAYPKSQEFDKPLPPDFTAFGRTTEYRLLPIIIEEELGSAQKSNLANVFNSLYMVLGEIANKLNAMR